MYLPDYHAAPGTAAMLDLVSRTRLATMIAVVDGEPVIDHLPFVLDRGRGEFGTLEAHVARANPIAAQLARGLAVTVVFQGPAHYLSPAWYPTKADTGAVVPTWNYTVVHARGLVTVVDGGAALLPMLERLTAANEAPLHGDGHWRVADAPPSYVAPLLDAIVGFEVAITDLQGRWKLAQDEALQDRQGAAASLRATGCPNARAMSALIESTLP